MSLLIAIPSNAQEINSEEATAVKPKIVKNTFQSTYIINMHSVEIVPKNYLQFMVAHHFGNVWTKGLPTGQNFAQILGLNSGIAKTYVSLDYSPSNFGNMGIALAGNLSFEGWVKFKLVRQQTGSKNIPVSISWLTLTNVNTQEDPSNNENPNYTSWNKFSFLHQLIIARKLNSKFSVQIAPTMVHYNIVPYGINNDNNIFSVTWGGKYQVKPNTAITLEYSRQINMYEDILSSSGAIENFNPNLFALGVEFNSGGHVFQFYIGNTTDATNITQLSRNTNFIKDGHLALGFRLNRSFFVGKE